MPQGGAHVGHPEWKPQTMVFVTDEGHRIWVVLNPETLKGFEGKHVTITGQLNAKKKTIQISSASEFKASQVCIRYWLISWKPLRRVGEWLQNRER